MLSRPQKLEWIDAAIHRAHKLSTCSHKQLHDKLYHLLFFPDEATLNKLVHASSQLLISDTISLTHLCSKPITNIEDLTDFCHEAIRPNDRTIFILAHLHLLKTKNEELTKTHITCIGNLFFRNNYDAFCIFAHRHLLNQQYQPTHTNHSTLFFRSHKRNEMTLTSTPSYNC